MLRAVILAASIASLAACQNQKIEKRATGSSSGASEEASDAIPGKHDTAVVEWRQLPADQQQAQIKMLASKETGWGKETPPPNPCAGVPAKLYLSMSRNKEWPPFYRHAWGEARVSTRPDMGDRYPVTALSFRVEMPALGSPVVDQRTCNGAATCPADAKYGGTIFGEFSAHWTATAFHPCFGTWRNDSSW